MTENAPTNGCERSRRQANYRHHPDNGLDKMRNNTNPREDNTCPGKIITEHLPNTNLFGVHTVGFFGGEGGSVSTLTSQYFHDWFHGQSPCTVNGLKMSSLPDITLQFLVSFVLIVQYMQTMGILRWRIVQTPKISVFGCHSESNQWLTSTSTYHLRSAFNNLGSLACNF